MRFSLSWLKEYVEINCSPEELAESLTMSGLEVESLEYMGKGLEGIIVAQIVDIRPHPNASKLVLCDVTDGTKHYNIVCGAKNMKTGDKVALAPSGTKLPPSVKFPDGILIQSAKIRGEQSEGMLCAENELGIGEEGDGIMILPDSSNIGNRLIDELGLDDVVFEVGVTPNRPDCLSVLGIAREVATILGGGIIYPDYIVREEGEDIVRLAQVEVYDREGCPRYSCRIVKDVKIGPAPDWLKKRLEASGIRSINNVVDITNYVLLELGQPLHAFDYDLIEGRKIVVRPAKDGEVIQTLDGVERHLTSEDLLICDAQKPVAIAGVMGGGNTEVSESTRSILLESAFFNPVRVRRTSKRTGLRSESSYRFERGVDPNGVVKALDRATELIRGLAGGEVSKGRIDIYPNPIEPREVKLSLKRVDSILGTHIEADKIKKITEGLGIETLAVKDSDMFLRIPTFRTDLTREIDLIEELARHYGYNRIPATLPVIPMMTAGLQRQKFLENRVKEILISSGFLEVINYSFEDPSLLGLFNGTAPLRILNPLSNEGSVMRTNLLTGIIKNVILNLNRQAQDIRLFETGKVYIPREYGLPKEITTIAAAATGRRQPELWDKEEFDFFDLKGILERIFEAFSISDKIRLMDSASSTGINFLHPGKSARILVEDEEAGYLGEIHPDYREKLEISKRIYLFELDLEKLYAASDDAKKQFTHLPKFPSVRRDIALVVDEDIPVGRILVELRKVESDLIEEVNVFDVFKGGTVDKGKKSVAISMILRSADRTLTDEEVEDVQIKGLNRLQSVFGAQLRKS
ncbi:MAG TPA: phenylalanine--tRNA ligase subunit beta [Thermodesulfobacteriota bacterium]|nr:phenylalanine--tRNA ligase subunit beta [Thermodesulfobacteriota bacterium]